MCGHSVAAPERRVQQMLPDAFQAFKHSETSLKIIKIREHTVCKDLLIGEESNMRMTQPRTQYPQGRTGQQPAPVAWIANYSRPYDNTYLHHAVQPSNDASHCGPSPLGDLLWLRHDARSFQRRRESILNTQPGRPTIRIRFCCYAELCKGLVKARS